MLGWDWHCPRAPFLAAEGKPRQVVRGSSREELGTASPSTFLLLGQLGHSLGRSLLSCSLLLLPARSCLARQVFPAGFPTYPGHLPTVF